MEITEYYEINNKSFKIYYKEFALRVIRISEAVRREGLIAFEDIIDPERVAERDIFDYGLQLVVDGTETELIDKILSNLIDRIDTYINDSYACLFATMEKEAVLAIQKGYSSRAIMVLLNSYTELSLKDDEIFKD
jgi:flagellar motor component MotA